MATTKAGTRTKKKATGKAGPAKKKKKMPAKAARKPTPRVDSNGRVHYPYKKVELRHEWEEKGYGISTAVSRAAARTAKGDSAAASLLRRQGLRDKKRRVAKGALAGVTAPSGRKYTVNASNKQDALERAYSRMDDGNYNLKDFKSPVVEKVAPGKYIVAFYRKRKPAKALKTLEKRVRALSGTPKRVRVKKAGAAKRDPKFKPTASQKRNLPPKMLKGLVKYHTGK